MFYFWRTIIKMAARMATVCRFALVDTVVQLFISGFLPNYLCGLLSSKIFPKVFRWKMAAKMAAACQIEHVWTFLLGHLSHNFMQISYRLLLSNYCSCMNMGLSSRLSPKQISISTAGDCMGTFVGAPAVLVICLFNISIGRTYLARWPVYHMALWHIIIHKTWKKRTVLCTYIQKCMSLL